MADPAYSAAALDDLKRQIAKKAIARDLIETYDWSGTAEDGFHASLWDEGLPPVDGPTGTIRLTFNVMSSSDAAGKAPPGARYLGDVLDHGMLLSKYDVDPWTDIYEPWVERINRAFDGWDSLPDPADYAGPIGQLRDAVTALTPGSDTNDGSGDTPFVSVELASDLGLLDSWVGPGTDGTAKGLLVFAFDDAYGATRIKAVMHNQAQAGIVLGMALLGEQRIWERTRRDIMRLAEQAKHAFDITEDGGSIDFTVVKAFLGLVKDFVPGPIKTLLDDVSDGLSLVQALAPPEDKDDPHPDIHGFVAEEILESMEKAIGKLGTTVFDQEYELIDHTLQGLLDEMRSQAGTQFHIHPRAGIAPDLVHAEQIDVHPEFLERVGYQTVPSIAAVMARAAQTADSADRPGIWQRAGGIGYAPSGPYAKWREVLEEFDAVTTGSAKELVEAGALLAQGAGFLRDADGYADAALAGVEDEIARGQDGWDNSHVGAPSPAPPHPVPGRPVPVPY